MTLKEWLEKCTAEEGQLFFERVPQDLQPAWACRILQLITDQVNFKPPAVVEVLRIGLIRLEWPMAHDAFSAVRDLVLDVERRKYPEDEWLQLYILSLAEHVAKVTYNSSGEPAPFDEDSGWYIAGSAAKICSRIGDQDLTEKVWVQLNTPGVAQTPPPSV